MPDSHLLTNLTTFTKELFPILTQVNPGIAKLEPYEFRYCLDNLIPAGGWVSCYSAARDDP